MDEILCIPLVAICQQSLQWGQNLSCRSTFSNTNDMKLRRLSLSTPVQYIQYCELYQPSCSIAIFRYTTGKTDTYCLNVIEEPL